MRSSYCKSLVQPLQGRDVLAALVPIKVVAALRTTVEESEVVEVIDITVTEEEMAVSMAEAEDKVVVGALAFFDFDFSILSMF